MDTASLSGARSHLHHIPTTSEVSVVLSKSARSQGQRTHPAETCKTFKPVSGPQPLCKQRKAGSAASTSPGLTSSQPHTQNSRVPTCLCQEAQKTSFPERADGGTDGPHSFPGYLAWRGSYPHHPAWLHQALWDSGFLQRHCHLQIPDRGGGW